MVASSDAAASENAEPGSLPWTADACGYVQPDGRLCAWISSSVNCTRSLRSRHSRLATRHTLHNGRRYGDDTHSDCH